MAANLLIIDNYDSFVINLGRYFGQLGFDRQVYRNNEITIEDIQSMAPTHIVISPGPCTPSEAGISIAAVESFHTTIPILGICLGHQAIAQAFGGKITRAQLPMHGKSSKINHHQNGIFKDIPNHSKVGRYHSLIVSHEGLPNNLIVDALSDEGEIMGIHHQQYPTFGLQFHPEAILTENGYQYLKNFMDLANVFYKKNVPSQ